MGPAPPLMTAHEYFRTPETVKPMELTFGALRVADSPSAYHQSIVIELFRALDGHVRERQLGRMWVAPLDVVLSEARAVIVQPDLFFVAHDQDGIVKERVYGAPELVIEVLSPNPRVGSIDERIGWFARFGVRECWLVHGDEIELSILRCATPRVAERVRLGATSRFDPRCCRSSRPRSSRSSSTRGARFHFAACKRRGRQFYARVRSACSAATAATRSCGSIGFARCIWKPLAMVRIRSSERA